MTIAKNINYPTIRRRAAFTLTEILIVIAIIGILVGLITPALLSALNGANEFTITNEVQQMDSQIENFRTEYGFYPPTIGPGLSIDTTNGGAAIGRMRSFLNRIAPNNSEGDGTTGTGLATWWNNVGCKLDERSSLVFWLSGIAKNKQYPLSGTAAIANSGMLTLCPYNADLTIDASGVSAPIGGTVERDVRFEFVADRLVAAAGIPEIRAYNQAAGRDGGDSAYRYLDSQSYGPFPLPASRTTPISGAYHVGFAGSPPVPIDFANPTTFQLVAPGMDGILFDPENTAPVGNIQAVDFGQFDNITNFSAGRLETLIN